MWIVVVTEPEEEDTHFRTFSTSKIAELRTWNLTFEEV